MGYISQVKQVNIEPFYLFSPLLHKSSISITELILALIHHIYAEIRGTNYNDLKI